MAERFKETIQKGGIRSEHEDLIRRFESSEERDPAVYVQMGKDPNSIEVQIDIPALSVNPNDAISIESLEKELKDPNKPWRGPGQKEGFKSFKKSK